MVAAAAVEELEAGLVPVAAADETVPVGLAVALELVVAAASVKFSGLSWPQLAFSFLVQTD